MRTNGHDMVVKRDVILSEQMEMEMTWLPLAMLNSKQRHEALPKSSHALFLIKCISPQGKCLHCCETFFFCVV